MIALQRWLGLFAAGLLCLLVAGCADSGGLAPVVPVNPESNPTAAETLPDGSVVMTGEYALGRKQQQYLWDIEHLVFALNQDVLSVFKTAIRNRDAALIQPFFSSQMQARVFSGPGKVHDCGSVRVFTWHADQQPQVSVDVERLTEHLVSPEFLEGEVENVGLHVFHLSPANRYNLDDVWHLKWDLRIQCVSQAGVRSEIAFFCSMDLSHLNEQMGSDSGWITSFQIDRARHSRSERELMADVTVGSGIRIKRLADNWNRTGPPYPPDHGNMRVFDYDRDGRYDLLISDDGRNHLYRQLPGGGFKDVTKQVGLRVPKGQRITGEVIADLDGDGLEDYLVSGGVPTAPGEEKKSISRYRNTTHAFKNMGDGTFQRIPPGKHGLGTQIINRFGVAVVDYDRDGKLDLYLVQAGKWPERNTRARWIGDKTTREGVLIRNLGDWKFEEVTVKAGMAGENVDSYGSVWLDIEQDGDDDLFLANHMGTNVIWENQGDGTFKKQNLPESFGGFSMGATTGDLDGDGRSEVYVANMYSSAGARVMDNLRSDDYPEGIFDYIQGFVTGNELYHNDDQEGLRPAGVSSGVDNSGWAYGPTMVDLDGDGRLDLYSPAGFQSVERGKPDG
jgi:hypothetical protein